MAPRDPAAGARGLRGDIHGIRNDFDGAFHEWIAFEATWAATEDFELGGRAEIAGWDEHEDRFNLFDDQGGVAPPRARIAWAARVFR